MEATMATVGWLKETWSGSYRTLAEQLLERWPSGLERDNELQGLANRLSRTDRGESNREWWDRHAALVPLLAAILRRSEAEVTAWLGGTATAVASPWQLHGLRRVTGARVEQPPDGLWSPLVRAWVEQVERHEVATRTAWLTWEPGVAGDWLKAWFEDRGWQVHTTKEWERVRKKLTTKGRHVVHLLGERPADPVLPEVPRGVTVCVLANHPLPGWTRRMAAHAYSWRSEVPVVTGWAALDAPLRAAPRGCLSWFAERCRPDRRPTDADITEIVAALGPDATPGDVLLRLDLAGDDDPVEAFLGRIPDASLDELLAIEREAARRGIGERRTRATWQDLVPTVRDTDELFAEVARYADRNNAPQVRRLLADRPAGVVARLVELRLLQPCSEPDAPAGTWRVSPRWLGRELARRALAQLANQPDGVGAALLSGDEGATTALDALRRRVTSSDWEWIRGQLAMPSATLAGVASVEAAALVVGHGVLDGEDVPVEIAGEAVAALRRVRAASGGARLLAHGAMGTSHEAVTLADWALGHRAGTSDPTFGPWDVLDRDHERILPQLEGALARWAGFGERAADPETGIPLARRVLRLGSWLFARHGVLPAAKDGPAVWTFQVPALLLAATRDEQALPGRSLPPKRLIDPDAPALRGALDGVPAAERAGFVEMLDDFFRQMAGAAPDVEARHRAVRAIVIAASRGFSLVKSEIERSGGSTHDALRWLWSQWNADSHHGRDVPPVALLREPDLEDARLVWRAAPEQVHRDIWERASREDAFWQVLPSAGWRAWALAGSDATEGWARMPFDVLQAVLNHALPPHAYAAGWLRDATRTLAWLSHRVAPDTEADAPVGRCLTATPGPVVPDVLALGVDRLPRWWLQHVVTERLDGWRDAWSALHRAGAGEGTPAGG